MTREAAAPLRITLGGGGTDLPVYCNKHGAYFIAAAIAWMIRVKLTNLDPGSDWRPVVGAPQLDGYLSDSRTDDSARRAYIKSSVPGGTGLGSSGALAVALVVARNSYVLDGETADRYAIADEAFNLETRAFTPEAGRQDTLVATFGGLREYEITEGAVLSRTLPISATTMLSFGRQFFLVDTGLRREASRMLAGQQQVVDPNSNAIIANLERIKELAQVARKELIDGDLEGLGSMMHEHWMIKRERSPEVSTPAIDDLYEFALRSAGVTGGKLIGAGGGGYLLLHTLDPQRTRAAFRSIGRSCLAVSINASGVRLSVDLRRS
jgi:D-glycero-alpha-D-manno-heptose-7-phosphate kinase